MSAPETAPPADADSAPDIGWGRAILCGLAVLGVAFFGGVYGANAIITKSLALTRTAREWLATGLVFLVVVVLAAALRWLQARKLI
jgi:hypothetical protein